MSESDDGEKMIYRFKIVRFVKRGRKGLTKEIDIVPSTWINWDEKTKRLKVPFLPPPYTKKNINELHEMVKQESEVPHSWPFYNIDIVGQAKTFTEAMDRLILLGRTDTAFSQDSEDDGEEKIKKAETVYRQQKLKKNVDEIKNLFNEIPVLAKKSCSQSDKHKSATKSSKLSEKKFTAVRSKLLEKNVTEKSIDVPTAKTSEPESEPESESEPEPEPESELSNNKHKSAMKSSKLSEKKFTAVRSKLSEKNVTEKSIIVPTAKTSEPESEPESGLSKNEHKSAMKSSKLSEKKFTAVRSKLSEKNFTEKSIIVPTAKTSESKPEPKSGLSNNQLPSIMLLDTQLPVITENDLIDYTNNKDPLSVDIDIDAIWSKLLTLESDSQNLNKKLDSTLIKLESLLFDTKILKNRTINQGSKSIKVDADNIFKKYEIILPAKTKEEFEHINIKLDKDREFRTNFCEHLYRYIEFTSTLTKNITTILKICVTRDIAVTYTATKTTLGKKTMKDEPFYSCIEDIFLQKEFKGEAVSRNGLVKALSAALSNAKDWEGHRKDRIKCNKEV